MNCSFDCHRLKFTQGAWSLPHYADDSTTCNCGFVLTDHLMGAVATIHSSDTRKIEEGDNPLPDEAKANGHLISTAPEMFAWINLALANGLTENVRQLGAEALYKATGTAHRPMKDGELLTTLYAQMGVHVAAAQSYRVPTEMEVKANAK